MRLARHPAPWLTAFVLWFAVLWWLSSGVRDFPEELDFRASDKLLHFGYFFGGAGLLSAGLFRLRPDLSAKRRLLLTVIVVTLVGVSDEIHQSFVPGRSGNDPADLLADFIGALAGALVFERFRRLIG